VVFVNMGRAPRGAGLVAISADSRVGDCDPCARIGLLRET
jgi:hypothetical protein